MIKVHCKNLDWSQQSSGCASNGSSECPLGMGKSSLGLILNCAHLRSLRSLQLISPAWQSSALINVALRSVPFPMFQHLTGCNFIFPFPTHDGSETVQVKIVFDPTAGLLPSFTTTEENSKISALLITAILWHSHGGWDVNTVSHSSNKIVVI